jgi:flagellar biosynthesis/type III secretory pathway ATPase
VSKWGAFIMKKLLLACIVLIGFATQVTAGVYEMISDLFAINRTVEQMQEQQEQKQLKKIENLSSLYKKAKDLDVGDEFKVPAFSKTMWNVCDYQMKRQNKMFQQWQQDQPEKIQMMNRYQMNRE